MSKLKSSGNADGPCTTRTRTQFPTVASWRISLRAIQKLLEQQQRRNSDVPAFVKSGQASGMNYYRFSLFEKRFLLPLPPQIQIYIIYNFITASPSHPLLTIPFVPYLYPLVSFFFHRPFHLFWIHLKSPREMKLRFFEILTPYSSLSSVHITVERVDRPYLTHFLCWSTALTPEVFNLWGDKIIIQPHLLSNEVFFPFVNVLRGSVFYYPDENVESGGNNNWGGQGGREWITENEMKHSSGHQGVSEMKQVFNEE